MTKEQMAQLKPDEQLLHDLISIKSYSGEERLIAEFIEEQFSQMGLEVFTQDGNVVARIEGVDRSRAFMFNSHMDTVAAGDSWTYDPWKPVVEDGRMYGLGASDMKIGLAASIETARSFSNEKPPVDLWFTYVVREEVDGYGTKSFASWFSEQGHMESYDECVAIVTEPTELTDIVYGHRGNFFLKATVSGDSGHSSNPSVIESHAVRNMIDFSDALNEECQQWKEDYPSDVFESPTVGELTSIQAGVSIHKTEFGDEISPESPNKFPEKCTATFDIRTTPDFDENAFNYVKALADKMGVEVDYAFEPCPAGYTDPKDPIIQASLKVLTEASLVVYQASADLGFLTNIGIQTIILGPGEKSVMHKPDEYCRPEQLLQAVDTYSKIIKLWAEKD